MHDKREERLLPQPEVRRADAGALRKAILLIALAVAALLVLIHLIGPWPQRLGEWKGRHGNHARSLILFGALVSLLLIWFALRLRRVGRLIIEQMRFPPESIKVVRDVVVETGDAAKRRGRLIVFASSMVASLSLILLGLMCFFALRLAGRF